MAGHILDQLVQFKDALDGFECREALVRRPVLCGLNLLVAL